MRERSLKRRTAFILAVLLTFMNCFSSFASETTDVTDNPEISENVDSTEDEVNNENTDASGVKGTTGAVSSVSDDDPDEEPTEESIEGSNEAGDENTSGQADDNDTVSGDLQTESDPDEDESEDDQSQILGSSLLTSSVRSLGATRSTVQLLGAGNDTDRGDGIWHTSGGIVWQVSENILTISPNESSSQAGKMSPGAFDGGTMWSADYKDIITEVYFEVGKEDPSKCVQNISEFAFKDCINLRSIYIPSYIRDIDQGAFIGCKKLSTIKIEENDFFVTDPETGILYKKDGRDGSGNIQYKLLFAPLNTGNIEMEISANTVEIGNFACYGATNYKGNLVIPETVRVIGQKAFEGCNNITCMKVRLANKRRYGDGLTEDECISALTQIKSDAFRGCTSLQEVYLPTSLTSIDSDCFTGDNYLGYVYYYSVKEALNTYDKMVEAVNHCDGLSNLYIPYGRKVFVPWNHCIISFYSSQSVTGDKDGNYLDPICVKYGSSLAVDGTFRKDLYVLEKEGYSFLGWYENQKGQFYNPNSTVTYDFKLKAQWNYMITITFNTGGGAFSVADASTGSTTTAAREISSNTYLDPAAWPENPSKLNAKFVGWQIGSAEKGSIILENYNDADASKYTNRYTRTGVHAYKFLAQDITLNAYYTDYTGLTFWNENGASQLGDRVNITYNEYLTSENKSYIQSLSQNYWRDNYNDDNYVFQGWYPDKEGVGTIFNADVKMYSTMPKKYYIYFKHYLNITYDYGYYSPKDKTDASGKRIFNGKEKGIVANNQYILEVPKARSGYRFDGWWSTADDSGTKYGSKIPANQMTHDMMFYAHWTKLCTVSLDRRYDTIYTSEYMLKHPSLAQVQTYTDITSGNQILYEYMIPYDSVSGNWKFAGWYKSTEFRSEDRIESTSKIEEDMTLYAKWEEGCAVQYLCTINQTGGRVVFWGKVVTPGSTLPLVPDELGDPDPLDYDYLGYLFDGWKNANGEEPDENLIVYEDLEYYSQWYDDPNTPNDPQVTVSFDSLGGPEVPSQTLSINRLINKPNEGTWDQHKFLGWFTDTKFNKLWDFSNDVISEDMTLYGKWIDWTEEDEDNAHGIYWVRMLRGGKAPLTEYFKESGLQFSYDKNVVKILQKGRTVKGKRVGETLITATKGDGSEYPVKVRAFVFKQELQDMYAFNTSTTLNAPDFLTVSGFLPDRWESTKPSVATIDSKTGFIQVKGRGRTKIKAYYNNKAVTATLYSEVPKFAKKFYRFKTGQSKKIKIKKVKKSDIVSWNIVSVSGDNSGGKSGGISGNGTGFAEVDNNGVVTAVSAGEVTLQATVYGQTITTKLHIEPPTLKTKQIQINVNKVKRLKLSRTKLKYVEWKSSNDSVAYVDPTSGKVYALKPGRVTLRTTAGGVTNTCNVIIEDPQAASASTLSKTANSTLKK